MLFVPESPLYQLSNEPVLMKLGMYIIVLQPMSMAYYINTSYQSVCLYAYVARQRHGETFTAVTNTYATTEKL
jgi:hypothetical protein